MPRRVRTAVQIRPSLPADDVEPTLGVPQNRLARARDPQVLPPKPNRFVQDPPGGLPFALGEQQLFEGLTTSSSTALADQPIPEDVKAVVAWCLHVHRHPGSFH